MSVVANGTTFNKRKVASGNDRVVRRSLFYDDAILQGCGISYNGLVITVGAGDIIAHGSHTQVIGGSITLDAISSGTKYCELVYTIDLTKMNTATDFQQGYFEVLSDSASYPALTKDNIDGLEASQTKYQVLFAKFQQSPSGITNWSDERPGERFELVSTLASMGTSLTFTDSRIRPSATVEIFTSVYGRSPKTVVVANGTITMTFAAKSGAVNVKVRLS